MYDAGTAMSQPFFEIRQHTDADGALRLTLIGEVDLAVADQLAAQLGQLTGPARGERQGVAEPEFIDCSGVGAIMSALVEARRGGWELDVDRCVSPKVARGIALAGHAPAHGPAAGG